MTLPETAGLDPREQAPWSTRRLWSLWDMKEFLVPSLLELTRELGRLVRHFEGLQADEPVSADARTSYIDRLDMELTNNFSGLGLEMCRLQCERIQAKAKSENPVMTAADAALMLDDLYRRLTDECSLRVFFALSTKEAECVFPQTPLFGPDVEAQFPSAAFEIEEAGKCLGLGRYTACVFHLMRVMEIAINSAGACLGIAPPVKDSDRNWGEILRKIKEEMDRRNGMKPKVWADQKDREFFADTYASLDAVRVAWRNTTMHVENKYGQEEAEHIFGAVRGFMKKIASRFDEKGDPKA